MFSKLDQIKQFGLLFPNLKILLISITITVIYEEIRFMYTPIMHINVFEFSLLKYRKVNNNTFSLCFFWLPFVSYTRKEYCEVIIPTEGVGVQLLREEVLYHQHPEYEGNIRVMENHVQIASSSKLNFVF